MSRKSSKVIDRRPSWMNKIFLMKPEHKKHSRDRNRDTSLTDTLFKCAWMGLGKPKLTWSLMW